MKQYKIKRNTRRGEGYSTMIITHKGTGEQIAEYRLTPGWELAEIVEMRRSIDNHIEDGGKLTNYQW
jgi:hypothetical protein